MMHEPTRVSSIWWGRSGIALGCAMAALLAVAGCYLFTAFLALRYPFGIDYGEGIVWHQMHMIMAGKGYGSIVGFPAIAFPYPPLYYVATAALASATGWDELASGRLLSVVSAIVAAGFIGAIASRLVRPEADPAIRRTCAVLAALLALATRPVLEWSILMRVDMLFVALSFAGVFFGLLALTRPRMIHVAALLFVAAIFTKQIAIAAPLAVFGTLLVVRPRTAFAGIVTGVVASLAALALTYWRTDGEFLRHILFYTINRFRPIQALDILEAVGNHFGTLALAVWGIRIRLRHLPNARTGFSAWARALRASPAEAGFVMLAGYLVFATLLLITALKAGSDINYFLEWCCLLALFAALALADAVAAGRRRFALVALVAVVLQAIAMMGIAGQELSEQLEKRAGMAQLTALIADAASPVVGDDMVAIVRGGKAVQWEPFIFAELAKKGTWDERPFIALIRQRHFAFFVTEGYDGDSDVFDERYTQTVSQAMLAAYPVERGLAGYTLHFPAGKLPALAAGLPGPPAHP
ncbi:MAG: hypothetical protein JWQ16_3014 [Novosphingobium sp.]|nr:hypothetical protein [Novosphingobium sp.]